MEEKSRRNFLRMMFTAFLAPLVLKACNWSLGSGKEKNSNENIAQAKDKKQQIVYQPHYIELQRRGVLKQRGKQLWEVMRSCELCPRKCRVDRISGRKGLCEATAQLEIASYHAHFGEERPLVGTGGSGTIFFSNCSLRCVFCINWEISQGGMGSVRSIEDMAAMMLDLQERGCHNINVVTPTHYLPHILLALDIAAVRGLKLPLVYNTCGWENMEVLDLLDGVVDIYLPDFKYGSSHAAAKYSAGATSYPQVTQAAVLEMHRQVGLARPAADGIVYRGLMVRHLVMPNRAAASKEVVEWLAGNLPHDTYVNIMSQYRPMHQAHRHPEISRRITAEEYKEVIVWARQAGLTNLDIQGMYYY